MSRKEINKFNRDCNDCQHSINEKYQLLKCRRRTVKLFDGTPVPAFCEDERHFEIGECKEEAIHFLPKQNPAPEQIKTE